MRDRQSDYLEAVERAKKQYEKYLELHDILKILREKPEVKPQRVPSFENPLTTDRVGLRRELSRASFGKNG